MDGGSKVVSAKLREQLGELDLSELRAALTYVEQRLDYCRPSIAEQIRAEADGEIVDIEDSGTYTLVRKRPIGQGDSKAAPQTVSLYRVRRQKQPNDEAALYWSYLGDVSDPAGIECGNCGVSLDERAGPCPRCGEGIARYDSEE